MAKLYLIPIPIADGALHTLSEEVARTTQEVTHFFVENVRTARRFLKALHPSIVIDDLHFSEIDKHNGPDTATLRKWLKEGQDIGVMSESGCPGIADPGSRLVSIAHELNAEVIPLTGPNSIILALMASGLNGQSFAFHGYLPLKEPGRSKRIKELEQLSAREKQTQIFIETPYRNNALLGELLKNCNNRTSICVAHNITSAGAMIKTRSVSEWKKQKLELEKQPTVFLLLA